MALKYIHEALKAHRRRVAALALYLRLYDISWPKACRYQTAARWLGISESRNERGEPSPRQLGIIKHVCLASGNKRKSSNNPH